MAKSLVLDLYTADIAQISNSADNFASLILNLCQDSYSTGADIVVFPEYTWMALEKFVEHKNPLKNVSDLFWGKTWSSLKKHLAQKQKMLVLGSCPLVEDNIVNRAPILCDGQEFYHDKIQLTPWEKELQSGQNISVFEFQNTKVAVLICFDIEFPEISSLLKKQNIDLILVPSACENILGVERIHRCASARSVEIGAYVGVSHLVGESDSTLVDINIGKLAVYAPSQSSFKELNRECSTKIFKKGFHRLRKTLDIEALRTAKTILDETNPCRLPVKLI